MKKEVFKFVGRVAYMAVSIAAALMIVRGVDKLRAGNAIAAKTTGE